MDLADSPGHWLENGRPSLTGSNPSSPSVWFSYPGPSSVATYPNTYPTRVIWATTHRPKWSPLNIRTRRGNTCTTKNFKTCRRLGATGQEPHICCCSRECAWRRRPFTTMRSANTLHPVTMQPAGMYFSLEKGGPLLFVKKEIFFSSLKSRYHLLERLETFTIVPKNPIFQSNLFLLTWVTVTIPNFTYSYLLLCKEIQMVLWK